MVLLFQNINVAESFEFSFFFSHTSWVDFEYTFMGLMGGILRLSLRQFVTGIFGASPRILQCVCDQIAHLDLPSFTKKSSFV